jgi:uridine kinase
VNKPFIVGVTGGSGSGKTFFLKCLLQHFNDNQVSLLSQDDYYIPVGHNLTKEENKLYNFDLPSAIDREQFGHDIAKLIGGETVLKKEYTFNNSNAAARILEIKSAPVIIIEGLFILHFEELSALLDYKVFIEANEQVALQRRMDRDLTERGYSNSDVNYKWMNHVLPAYHQYLLPFKDDCDRIVINDTNVVEDMMAVTKEVAEQIKKSTLIY